MSVAQQTRTKKRSVKPSARGRCDADPAQRLHAHMHGERRWSESTICTAIILLLDVPPAWLREKEHLGRILVRRRRDVARSVYAYMLHKHGRRRMGYPDVAHELGLLRHGGTATQIGKLHGELVYAAIGGAWTERCEAFVRVMDVLSDQTVAGGVTKRRKVNAQSTEKKGGGA